MECFRQWLLGVVACSLAVTISTRLAGEGKTGGLVRFTGGLLLLCAMLRPLAQLELPEAGWNMGGYRAAVAQLELELRGEREITLSDSISERLASYIEDKAGSLGMEVRATVAMELRNNVPVPVGVTLRGEYSAELADYVERELGIAQEKQTWIVS